MEMSFKNKIVVITGGGHGIGKCCAECFSREGAIVHVIDVKAGPWFVGDIAEKDTLERFAADVLEKSGHVDVLVNNAPPLFKGIDECTYDEFMHAQAVGVAAPFYLAKLFKDHFGEGASIINISSSRDRMSQPQSESYTAAKGGIAALTHGLAASLAGKVRVNSISPFAGRVGNPLDIANMVLFLASDKAGFITGENICIDGGMTRNMIYTGDFGWKLEK